jgi:hypothetical protein
VLKDATPIVAAIAVFFRIFENILHDSIELDKQWYRDKNTGTQNITFVYFLSNKRANKFFSSLIKG